MEHNEIYKELNYLSISNESFSETLTKIIKAIVKRIDKFLTYISDFASYSVPLFNLDNQIEDLLSDTRTNRLANNDKAITINSGQRYLTVNHKSLTKLNDLRIHFNNLKLLSTEIFNYKKDLLNVNTKNLDTIEVFRPSNYFKNSSYFKNDVSIHLLGNYQIKINENLTLIDSNNQPMTFVDPINFERIATGQQLTLLNSYKDLIKILSNHYTGQTRSKLVNTLKDLKRELRSLKETDSNVKDRILKISLFTSWLNVLEESLFHLNIKVIKTGIRVAEANIAK